MQARGDHVPAVPATHPHTPVYIAPRSSHLERRGDAEIVLWGGEQQRIATEHLRGQKGGCGAKCYWKNSQAVEKYRQLPYGKEGHLLPAAGG